jgi:hypothetical protein
LGVRIAPHFGITQSFSDTLILVRIAQFFKNGNLKTNRSNSTRQWYPTGGIDTLSKIIVPFYDKYPLQTQKHGDFLR